MRWCTNYVLARDVIEGVFNVGLKNLSRNVDRMKKVKSCTSIKDNLDVHQEL